MKTRVFVMIALLFAVGSASGQVVFEPLSPNFQISQSINDCNLKIENTGSVDFQFAFLGLGSPDQTFPDVVLKNLTGNTIAIGEWYNNSLCYFILDSTLETGASMEFQLISSNGSSFSIREAEVFARIGDNTTNKKGMSTGDSIIVQSCIGQTTSVSKEIVPRETTIYPNPTSGFVNIDFPENIEKVNIINLLGYVIFSITTPQQIDMTTVPKGIYFVQFNFKNGIKHTKTMVYVR